MERTQAGEIKFRRLKSRADVIAARATGITTVNPTVNLAVQHARGDVAGVGRRTLRRVLTGTKTYEEQHGDALAASPGYAAFIERELRPTM